MDPRGLLGDRCLDFDGNRVRIEKALLVVLEAFSGSQRFLGCC
jgi:hypothetical protein